MRLFLGVDGGQSSTIALIAREDGQIVGSGRSGPCNHVSADEAAAKFSRVMADCVAQACASAAIDPAEAKFAGVCCGMSGGADDKTGLICKILRAEQLSVVTDGEIALTGALCEQPGIIVIAGTGSFGLGRNTVGRLARAGGWGYVFGDEGSAFDIARQATRAALRFEEGGGPATYLHQELLKATGASSALVMLHSFYSEAWPRPRVAELAVLVDSAAERGDNVAGAIISQAAQSLSVLAACVHESIFKAEEHVRVSHSGGAFQSRLLLNGFRNFVELSGCVCVDPLLNPAAGALLQAFQLCGLHVTLSHIPDVK